MERKRGQVQFFDLPQPRFQRLRSPGQQQRCGQTSGSSSLEVGRTDATSGSSRKVTRTDSAGGSSSFNGNVSRQGSKYSRSGDISRSSNGKAGIELTARSNYSIGSTQYWTITGDKKGVKYRF